MVLLFREGAAHVSPDGAVRVITSTDGQKWASAARLTREGADLRDAKLTITPDGRLMLNAVAAFPASRGRRSGTGRWSGSRADGKEWGEGKEIGEPNFWLWRVAWHGKTAYARRLRHGRLRRSPGFIRVRMGSTTSRWSKRCTIRAIPNEAGLTFLDDGTLLCLLRRDGGGKATGLLGTAKPPYKEWAWKDLGSASAAPHMIRLPDGRLVAGVRLYDKQVRTSLCWVDPDAGTLTEFLTLPSGGDTSYPGLVCTTGCCGSATIPRTRGRRASTWRRCGCRRGEPCVRPVTRGRRRGKPSPIGKPTPGEDKLRPYVIRNSGWRNSSRANTRFAPTPGIDNPTARPDKPKLSIDPRLVTERP